MSNSLLRILVDETVAKVDSLITHDTILSWDLRVELRQLLELLAKTRPEVQHSEEKRHTANAHAGDLHDYLFVWYLLREVPHKAEEVIDELAYEILRPKVTQVNFLKKLIFNLKFVRKVKILNQTLQKSYFLFELVRSVSFDVKFISDTVLSNDPIIGREDDASKVVNLLTRSSDQRVLTVVPIVGMCGLGKTALAKLVCRRVMAMNLFDVKMWVCVSENCDELKVLNQMLRSLNATMGSLSLTNKDEILRHLEKELVTKKFLLFLDDVCEDMSRFWGDFRTWLLKVCRNNGNVVLVTSRSKKVTSILETSSHHRHTLHHLSGDDCWFILKERAFRNVKVESNLKVIGREIARKCRGVPLAAKVLGGTLGFNRDEEAWLKIRDSDVLKQKARNNEENVKWILQLCFDHLPSCLKPCFAICSVFPKGFLIVKEDLIQLWIVERLVASYDIGNEYFHALLVNSFFQPLESDDDGNVINCKMLNIAPYLALHLDIFKISGDYLYVDYQSIRTSEALLNNKAEYLHTIILNNVPFRSSYKWKSLRTLFLNNVDMKNLPSPISRLKHFKYIHVSNTNVSPLRESVPHMYMLQILTLSNCNCEQLPLLGDLPFLTFLRISHMKKVKFIGNESYEVNSSPRKLRLFPALKSLSLNWMENLIAWSPPSRGNLVVVFPELQNLSIRCCAKLAGFPMRHLSALKKVELKDCEELRFLFDEHTSFPDIRSVSIVGCPKLTYLRNWLLSNESCKEFRVRRCEWLKFIPEDLGMRNSLVSLEIYCCKGLGFFPEEILCKLTQLRKLRIGAFSEMLDDFRYLNRIKDISCLEELEIWGSDVFGRKMCVLPNQLQHLASLKSLMIKGFTTMEAFPEWLCNLRCLKTISLNYCWHLEYLSTATIMRKLSNLSHVYIYGCRALEEHKSKWMEFSGRTKIRIHFQ